MDYSSNQLRNAINGKSASKGGLNVYEIRDYLIAHNIDPSGDRKTLEYKLQQVVDDDSAGSRAEDDFITDTYVSKQELEVINKQQRVQNAKYMRSVHAETPTPTSGLKATRGRGFVRQGMYGYK